MQSVQCGESVCVCVCVCGVGGGGECVCVCVTVILWVTQCVRDIYRLSHDIMVDRVLTLSYDTYHICV